jgi:hypothetical protein
MSNGTCTREDGERGQWPSDQILIECGAWKWFFFVFSFPIISLVLLSLLSLSLIKSSC